MLKLFLMFFAGLALFAQTPTLSVLPAALTLEVDQINEEIILRDAVTVVASNTPHAMFQVDVPMYQNAISVDPASAIVFGSQQVSIRILPRLLPLGGIGVPIHFRHITSTGTVHVPLALMLTVVNTRTPVPVPSTGVSYLPHLAIGGGWQTEIMLVNSGGDADIELVYLHPIGTQMRPPSRFKLARNQTTSVTLGGGPRVVTGTVQVKNTGGQISSWLLFRDDSGRETTIPGTSVSRGLMAFPADLRNGSDLGIAVMNTSGVSQTIVVDLFHEDGSKVITYHLAVSANGQVSMALSEFAPMMRGRLGTVVLSSTSPSLAGFALRFFSNGNFTSLVN